MENSKRNLFSGQSVVGGEAGDKKTGQHIEELANSVRGWRLGIAGPCMGIPACQTGTAASYPGAKPDGLSSIELPGGEHVSFGSVTWKYNLQRCATGGARQGDGINTMSDDRLGGPGSLKVEETSKV